jgi:predicted dehydrogenase
MLIMIMLGLENSKHVFVEKPLALTLKDVEKVSKYYES